MNYDDLLSQLTEKNLNIAGVVRTSTATAAPNDEKVAVESAAVSQTIQLTRTTAANTSQSETSTPQRKISTSSRFINAFQNFYGGNSSNAIATSNSSSSTPNLGTSSATVDEQEPSPSNSTGRTPTKGMESKLLSMWHNVKYGWSNKMKSNFSKEQPVWLLGRCYHRKYTPPSSMENSTELNSAAMDNNAQLSYAANAYESTQNVLYSGNSSITTASSTMFPELDPLHVEEIVIPQELGMDAVENQVMENPWEEGIEGFRRDFYSRLWMTYRREFPIMNGSNYTSDCGWGCMLRSGQMLLAQALVCHFLSRNWRYDPDTQLHSTYEDNMHRKIIKWFGDSSSRSSPFSIHALVNLGQEMGKKPGDWYGPASVSYLLKQALKNASQENADFDNIAMYVAKDCTIYIEDVKEECSVPEQKNKHDLPWKASSKEQQHFKSSTHHWKSLIILIPLRLGTEKLNLAYAHSLKLLLSTEYCIGIIGGRPKHSLYFVGFQEDKLIHLDPHYCQEMVDINQDNFPVQTFHCKSPRKLKTAKMDPSCCIGFYCQTKADFDNFVESVQLYLNPMRCVTSASDKIMFVSHHTPSFLSTDSVSGLQSVENSYPLFTFSRGCSEDNIREQTSESLYKPIQRQLVEMRHELGFTDSNDDDNGETEEFVLL